jgi:hypothetical protein
MDIRQLLDHYRSLQNPSEYVQRIRVFLFLYQSESQEKITAMIKEELDLAIQQASPDTEKVRLLQEMLSLIQR